MRTYLEDLNSAQRTAVEHYEGPSLVIAGAGSGKTRVLTYRIAHLLSMGVHPFHILALTFTNKAAREMKDRIGQLVGPELALSLWMGTFHSIFARILRMEGKVLDYPSSYTIYDTTDTKNILKVIIKEMNLDDQQYKPAEIYGRISSAKNNLVTPKAYYSSTQLMEMDRTTRRPHIADIYMKYSQRLKKADAMDFDDLLLNTYILFRDFPEILEKYQNLFQFVLVDEYQDTNYVQYMIIKHLSAKNKNICVVGDDAQSIYSFRGARIENILNFRNDYPQYKLYKLEQNYRSTQTIVNAANSLINKNRDQISKKVWSDNEPGDKIRLIRAATDNEEGYLVSNMIQDSIYSDHFHYRDYAILYRTNAQSRIFEESLRKLNIPYKVYGSLSFYHRKEIKDLLAYFRLTVNPHDEEALLRIINYPARGIGNTTISKLEGLSDKFNKRIWEILLEIDIHAGIFNKGTLSKLYGFVRLISGYRDSLKRMEAFNLAFTIAESSGILKDLHVDKSPENISKYENIQELLNGIKEYTDRQDEAESSTLDAYLQNVALLTDQDTDKAEDRNKVAIMTIHSAKGLEFKQVFVAGLEEDLFPSRLSYSTREELEEERRLFYVAITRAMKKVTLSYASSRYKWGVLLNCTPSRFLKEIDPVHLSGAESIERTVLNQPMGINTNRFSRPPAKKQPATPRKFFEADDPFKIQMGMEVEHPRFGMGKIISLEGEGTDRKATVFFREAGQKQLLLKFAKLKIVKPI
ncbi:MAG: UvrD-helicase domain-containing protein [Bacteroidales bacterium]|nr:UvrD-helicase domain-containing protein [Bacteroidales bacterium]